MQTSLHSREPSEDPGQAKGWDARSGTLLRGLAILDLLVPTAQPLALGDIASQVGLDQSTTLRLLRALEDNGRVIRSADGKRYLPSPSTLRPLPLLHPLEQLRREAAPILQELAQRVSQTVILVVFLGTERLVVDVVQTPRSLSPYYSTWLKGPLHASAPGKALLLTMSPEQRRAALGEAPYRRWTDHTIVDAQDLERNLAEAAASGVALVRDEDYEGLSAASAIYQGWDGRALGCIGITGHSAAFTAETVALIQRELRSSVRLMPLQASALAAVAQLSARFSNRSASIPRSQPHGLAGAEQAVSDHVSESASATATALPFGRT